MKKLILICIVIFCSKIAFSQTGNNMAIGTIDTIQSKILNEQRKILVYVPNRTSKTLFAPQRYPVVYLLDGDEHFYSVVGMIQQLSEINGNSVIPEMIVVGISNTNRTRDLTPRLNIPNSSTGGVEVFTSFLEEELIHYINSTYPTTSYKMLIGHSFGGLTVINTLINHTKMFNSYICIDPSMDYDRMNFLTATKKALSEKDFTGTRLYLGIANSVEIGMKLKKILADSTFFSQNIRAIFETDKFIRSKKPRGLLYESKYYENDTHFTVPFISEYDGLRFIFDTYQYKMKTTDWTDATVPIAQKFKSHYEEVSKQFGYEVAPPEAEINRIGYVFLQQGQFEKAESLFALNVSNYPKSFNAYDSYGDYFVVKDNKQKAIENFNKALSLNEYPETRQKLNKLLK